MTELASHSNNKPLMNFDSSFGKTDTSQNGASFPTDSLWARWQTWNTGGTTWEAREASRAGLVGLGRVDTGDTWIQEKLAPGHDGIREDVEWVDVAQNRQLILEDEFTVVEWHLADVAVKALTLPACVCADVIAATQHHPHAENSSYVSDDVFTAPIHCQVQPWCNPLWLTGLKAPTN